MRINLIKMEKKETENKGIKFEFTWEYAPEDIEEYGQFVKAYEKFTDNITAKTNKE